MAIQEDRLPKYGRVSNPPPMRVTERDKRILEAIHNYDGMLGFFQIKRMFFTGKSQTEQRMKLLYQHKYVNRPNKDLRRRLPEMIYWLDSRGAQIVASLQGTPFNQFSWRKEPRKFQVEHDLAVNDFRLDVIEACNNEPKVEIETWVPEREFWSYPDTIFYEHGERTLKRKIIPDGYFSLLTPENRIRYLIEIDRSTEDNPRFVREKILPGLAYIKSKAYEERFGHRSGRWLVATTSDKRMKNMLNQARRGKTKGLFYFTTYDQLNVNTLLFTPIWHRVDREDPVPLLFIE